MCVCSCHNALSISFVVGLTNAFAKAVKLNGGSVFEDCPVSNINLNSTNAVKSVSVGKHQVKKKDYKGGLLGGNFQPLCDDIV